MIKRIAQVAMASLMWVAIAGPAKAQDDKMVYVIDKKVKHQVIDNFGASDAWRCDFIGKYWPEEKRERIADLLFKREFDEEGNPIGMALTTWRVNIGAGSYENREAKEVNNSWNRTECFLAPDGTYDFSKQAGQRWFMQAAKERGMNNFLFFANSAPYFMTRSGATVAADGKYINLREDKFDDFAQFLVTCAAHFRNEGYGVNYISPINEPNVEWHTNFFQEGSFATRDDIFRMVEELDWALGKQKVDAKIIVPEMGELKCLFDVYEDENILLADKKPGVLCHSAGAWDYNTLIANIQAYLVKNGEWDPRAENSFAPALCNRIDRNTGGIVIAAKNAEALRLMNEKIKHNEITKLYLCAAHGIFKRPAATLTGYLFKDSAKNTVTVSVSGNSRYSKQLWSLNHPW